MRITYLTKDISRRGKITHKLLSTAATVFLLFGTTVSGLAQTEFTGSLTNVSITDIASTNSPPNTIFSYTQDGNTLTFNASDSFDPDGTITELKWDFGDGSGAKGASPQHTYIAFGQYSVTLTIKDNSGGITIAGKEITLSSGEDIGTQVAGTSNMMNSSNHVFFHKLQGTPSMAGTLTNYKVTVSESAASGRMLSFALYSHNAANDKPFTYIANSDSGWHEYQQQAGATLTLAPSGAVTIDAGTQYWVGVRGKNYGGIKGTSSTGTYYDYYTPSTTTWSDEIILKGVTARTGTATILQIEVTP